MSSVLAMENVTAGYIGDIDVLRSLSLTVEAGSITGLIGLNGAGKSTVMKSICGFLTPKSGRVVYEGNDITGLAPHHLSAKGIWYIPQESSLFPFMTVTENLRLPLESLSRATGTPNRAEVDRRFDEMLAKFPALRPKLKAQAGDLSGGQQKMVEFAKAWLMRPRLCLIDEPSIGLSPKIVEEVFEWIKLFASEQMAILLVDHNVRRVISMSQRIYVLSLGEITASGAPEDFQGNLHEQVKSWLGINF
ncbi:ABC transporter ATP-binding protein [Afipia sp. Root123D2]|uniref:ABC transporter ATP-binding protein n=1 Tax=Afipia sp. Root123D2 TaxID=1736436 RepID=UPI0006FFCAF7|nr:ABC transporter ATP-binding protein [Afipia sp. Root123D2]KQW20883.1 ABC transporter ATP-binding protein [Afipia sp. Root123D2]